MSEVWSDGTRTASVRSLLEWRSLVVTVDRLLVTPAIYHVRHLVSRVGFSTATPQSPCRVLRWVFCKNGASVKCELTCASDAFELTTTPPFPPGTKGVEMFAQVTDAFQRQCDVEAALIRDGWTLELHESILA